MTDADGEPARRRTRRRAGRGRVRTRPRGRRGPGHAGRPQRLPPVPAVALPGRHVAAAGRGHRPPHRTIFREHPTVEIRTADVAEIDAAERSAVTLSDGESDQQARTWSSRPARDRSSSVSRARPSTRSRCIPSPTRSGCGGTCRTLLHAGSAAEPADDGALDVVVVGGGPTGVEIAGALAELMAALVATERITQARDDHSRRPRQQHCSRRSPRKSHKYAHKRLTKQGVELRLGTGVAAVHADRVELDDGSSIRDPDGHLGRRRVSRSVVGNVAGLTTGRGGRIDVLPDLTVDGPPARLRGR